VIPTGCATNSTEGFVLRGSDGLPLPALSTATQIGDALQVSSRTILEWEAQGKIPAALRSGRTVRFNPQAIVKALGIAVG
jgi:hypothetical protein